jgi:hypothetical protein
MRPTTPERPTGSDGTWAALGIAALLHAALLALTPLFPASLKEAELPGDAVKGDLFDIETAPAPARPSDEPRAAAAGEADKTAEAQSPPSEQRAKTAESAAESAAERAAEEETPPPGSGALRAKVAERVTPEPAGAQVPEPAAAQEPAPSPEARSGAEPAAAAGAMGTAGTPGAPGQAPSEGPPGDAFSPLEGTAPLTGLGGTPVWSMPGVIGPGAAPRAAPTAAPGARPVDKNIAGQVLSGSLHKKDQEIGLDMPAGGVVASTIADAVRGSEVPKDVRATFEVKLGADGKVIGVRVVSSSAGDAGSWERIARNAGAALASRSLTMSGDAAARGATVTVKIESKIVYPAGTKVKYDVAPVCANEVIEDLIDGLSTPIDPGRGPINDPAVNRPDPGKETAEPKAEERRRLFCIPIGVKGSGDLSNLGAPMQTVVRSSFKVNVPGSKQLEDVKEVDQRAPWSKPDPNKVQKIRPKWKKKKKKP